MLIFISLNFGMLQINVGILIGILIKLILKNLQIQVNLKKDCINYEGVTLNSNGSGLGKGVDLATHDRSLKLLQKGTCSDSEIAIPPLIPLHFHREQYDNGENKTT